MLFFIKIKELGTVYSALRQLCAWLCQLIYPLIAGIFNLFLSLAKFNMAKYANINEMYHRVTIILTIIMVFYITLELIKYLVTPDTILDKEKGATKITYKVVIVVLLIAFVPKIFELAFTVQSALINGGAITSIITGKAIQNNNPNGTTADFSEIENTNDDLSNQGGNFSAILLSIFYNYDEDYWDDKDGKNECETDVMCKDIYYTNMDQLGSEGRLDILTMGLQAGEYSKENSSVMLPLLTFDGLFAVLVGAFILYILVIYSVDVGARVFKLLFLQIIAPIPILGYLSPKKDGIFGKWVKQCVATYLDVFIRLAIINFVLLMCEILTEDKLKEFFVESWNNKLLLIALILGLILFAQKLPKMLEELFPKLSSAGGNFGLKPGDRNLGQALGAALGLTAGTAVGAATGLAQGLRKVKSDPNAGFGKKAWNLISGGVGGTVRGTIGGAGRGLIHGGKKGSHLGDNIKGVIKGVDDQVKANKAHGDQAEAGYTGFKKLQDKVGETFGVGNRKQQLEQAKKPIERLQKERQAQAEQETKVNELAEKAWRKGKGDENVRRAVAKVEKIEGEEADLKAPDSAERRKYAAGKRKVNLTEEQGRKFDEAETRRNEALSRVNLEDIKRGVADDEVHVDKSGFMRQKTIQEYDKAAHEAAKGNYKRKTGILDPVTGKEMETFDKEAWERDKGKFNRERVVEELDQEAYDHAVDAEKTRIAETRRVEQTKTINDTFNAEVSGLVYANDAAAEEARIARLGALAKEKKDAIDEANWATRDWALQKNEDGQYNDGEIQRTEELGAQREQIYNGTAAPERKVNTEAEIRTFKLTMAKEKLAERRSVGGVVVNPEEISDADAEAILDEISTAKARDQWLKKTVKNSIQETQLDINKLDAQIQTADTEISSGTKPSH